MCTRHFAGSSRTKSFNGNSSHITLMGVGHGASLAHLYYLSGKFDRAIIRQLILLEGGSALSFNAIATQNYDFMGAFNSRIAAGKSLKKLGFKRILDLLGELPAIQYPVTSRLGPILNAEHFDSVAKRPVSTANTFTKLRSNSWDLLVKSISANQMRRRRSGRLTSVLMGFSHGKIARLFPQFDELSERLTRAQLKTRINTIIQSLVLQLYAMSASTQRQRTYEQLCTLYNFTRHSSQSQDLSMIRQVFADALLICPSVITARVYNAWPSYSSSNNNVDVDDVDIATNFYLFAIENCSYNQTKFPAECWTNSLQLLLGIPLYQNNGNLKLIKLSNIMIQMVSDFIDKEYSRSDINSQLPKRENCGVGHRCWNRNSDRWTSFTINNPIYKQFSTKRRENDQIRQFSNTQSHCNFWENIIKQYHTGHQAAAADYRQITKLEDMFKFFTSINITSHSKQTETTDAQLDLNSALNNGNTTSRADSFGWLGRSKLFWTIIIGCSLLLLNLVIFIAIYLQSHKELFTSCCGCSDPDGSTNGLLHSSHSQSNHYNPEQENSGLFRIGNNTTGNNVNSIAASPYDPLAKQKRQKKSRFKKNKEKLSVPFSKQHANEPQFQQQQSVESHLLTPLNSNHVYHQQQALSTRPIQNGGDRIRRNSSLSSCGSAVGLMPPPSCQFTFKQKQNHPTASSSSSSTSQTTVQPPPPPPLYSTTMPSTFIPVSHHQQKAPLQQTSHVRKLSGQSSIVDLNDSCVGKSLQPKASHTTGSGKHHSIKSILKVKTSSPSSAETRNSLSIPSAIYVFPPHESDFHYNNNNSNNNNNNTNINAASPIINVRSPSSSLYSPSTPHINNLDKKITIV